MREVKGFGVNSANEKLKIEVMDEPGAGGANHFYRVSGMDSWNSSRNANATPDSGMGHPEVLDIFFQNGTIPENGVNGVTQEALLAIVIDRLRSFQAGKFACRENALAVTKLEEAMHWLQHRTRSRIDRGVEGAHKV